jgi:hypothetical protein
MMPNHQLHRTARKRRLRIPRGFAASAAGELDR